MLRQRLAQLETPWLLRAFSSLSALVWGPCAAGAPAPARNGHYEAMPDRAADLSQASAPHISPSPPAAMTAS